MKLTTEEIIEKIKNEKTNHEILPTGIVKLDKLLDGGFFSKEIIILGAHTGVGKSQMAGQILLNIVDSGFKSAYFSLEISSEMVLSRLIALKTNIKSTTVRFGNLTPDEFEKKNQIETELLSRGDLLNFYDDCYDLEQIVKEVRDNKYEFVVVDFIQNILGKSDEYTRLSNAAIILQKLAKDTGCTILILSQLSNTAAKDGGKSKVLEYKGSGSIAMVADLGLFLEKPGQEDDYTPELGTELTLKKNRRGISGYTIRLGFSLPGGKIYEK